MAYRYNLINDFLSDDTVADTDYVLDDAISTSPYWVMAVVRLNKPLSYSRADAGTNPDIDFSEGIELKEDALVLITDDCIDLTVESTKEGHTSALKATLLNNENYLAKILPGDWVVAWMVYGKDTFDKLKQNVLDGKICNHVKDGLKFIGRAHSIRKHISVDGGSGLRTTRYQLQAYGFHEFDSNYIYSQFLADDSDLKNKIGVSLAKMGISINDIIEKNATIETVDNVHLLIAALLNIYFGKGMEDLNSEQADTPQQGFGPGVKPPPSSDGKNTQAPGMGLLVPKTIMAYLGRGGQPKRDLGRSEDADVSTAGNELPCYIDALQAIIGIQSYDGNGFLPTINTEHELTKGIIRYTGTAMLGTNLILPLAFENRTVWEMMYQFLNPMLNEMYTCMKIAEDGRVYPTIVVRQIPFTTALFADKRASKLSPTDLGRSEDADISSGESELHLTKYMDLPRWFVPSEMVEALDIGTSNATRTNFVWILGQDPNQENNLSPQQQAGLNGPVIDQYDVCKNGLSAKITIATVNIVNQEGSHAHVWSEIYADHAIGSQYTLNGTVRCLGVLSPVCEGDNLELAGITYHIEGFSHNCTITENGDKRFRTTFSLQRGMPVDDDGSRTDTDEDNSIYAPFESRNNSASEELKDTAQALDPQNTTDE